MVSVGLEMVEPHDRRVLGSGYSKLILEWSVKARTECLFVLRGSWDLTLKQAEYLFLYICAEGRE